MAARRTAAYTHAPASGVIGQRTQGTQRLEIARARRRDSQRHVRSNLEDFPPIEFQDRFDAESEMEFHCVPLESACEPPAEHTSTQAVMRWVLGYGHCGRSSERRLGSGVQVHVAILTVTQIVDVPLVTSSPVPPVVAAEELLGLALQRGEPRSRGPEHEPHHLVVRVRGQVPELCAFPMIVGKNEGRRAA